MSNTAELIFVPTPGMGHLLSTVEFAKLILHRDHRICITILIINLPIYSAKINPYVESQSRDNPYPTRLIFHTLPLLSNPPDSSTPNFFSQTIELHKPLVKKAVEDKMQAGSSKPACFVLDMFCTTMIDVAKELQVPSYIYFTSGSNVLNLIFHMQSLADDHGVDVVAKFGDPGAEFSLPGFKHKLQAKNIPPVFLDETGHKLVLTLGRGFREARGILVNTYMELDSFCTQALLDEGIKNESFPTIYPVGPILELNNTSHDNGGSRKEDKESIMQWLDDQPESSVVFLCFGSMGSFEEEQVKEIAHGLERSGHRFLWSLRKPPPEGGVGEAPSENETFEEALPEGFLERTANQGKIIGWAPQVSVLAHPSIGGFVSHCGWNSTLESLWFGVPMATWPMYAEQQLNAFELVKELGLAVEIRMDYQLDRKARKGNFLVTAEEVETGVKNLMNMDKVMRERVKETRDKGRIALEDGGSSYNYLGRFIEDVLTLHKMA